MANIFFKRGRSLIAVLSVVLGQGSPRSLPQGRIDVDKPAPQYEFQEIVVPGATASEPLLDRFSVQLAAQYVEDGALAWTKEKKCVTCHTNGTYMLTRPALTPFLGPPSKEIRRFFVESLEAMKGEDRKRAVTGVRPQVAYIAAGLAEWDAHIDRRLSAETEAALQFMFELQRDDGSWGNDDCWPPLESSAYQTTTVAALAAATAPGWLQALKDRKLRAGVEKLRAYLRETKPPHDYDRLLLLWASARMSGLLDERGREDIIEMVWRHQRADGGWSIRTFAAPEAWGRGNRAEKLRSEPEFSDPPSDGHQTGLAVLVLRDAGIPADHPDIRRAVEWLTTHQRVSGRWWTRSLNTDGFHFITYSGTCYPLLALAKCGVLPELGRHN